MGDATEAIESAFPLLRESGWEITSPATGTYNCIAWALGRTDAWFWPPGGFGHFAWPEGVPARTDLDAFIALFEQQGFGVQREDDAGPADRIAIFVRDGKVTHASRQLSANEWTSKLGRAEDVRHPLAALEGETYGTVAAIMIRAPASETAKP